MPSVLTQKEDERAGDAIRTLRNGGMVCYPTDTTYALGVNGYSQRALGKLVSAKGRDSRKPISIAVSSVDRVIELTANGETTRKILRRLLPGPVTVILKPGQDAFMPPIANADGWVGFRVPDHGFCRAMLSQVDFPVTATSANPGGMSAATDVQTVMNYPREFLDNIDLIIDGGATKLGGASTVMQVTETGDIVIVREGVLSRERILELVR